MGRVAVQVDESAMPLGIAMDLSVAYPVGGLHEGLHLARGDLEFRIRPQQLLSSGRDRGGLPACRDGCVLNEQSLGADDQVYEPVFRSSAATSEHQASQCDLQGAGRLCRRGLQEFKDSAPLVCMVGEHDGWASRIDGVQRSQHRLATRPKLL